ncbi:complex I intermediate-associated protein 30, mitochondrial-like isoform X2 [Battus philenor]|uniref:complex I intermediate-associated protein 30, mitochondrial-like isoform X2 n=1 Tax=Battus philenor TaxID=42288 RepID=UPI0035CFC4DF
MCLLNNFSKLHIVIFLIFTIVQCYQSNITPPETQYLFDFTKFDDVDNWQEQSDTVRDVGMSKAVLALHQNTAYRRAIFFALLNPQMNGAGFAGIRAKKTYNLTGYTKLQIKCRAQGQYNGFKVVLRHKGLNDEPNYSFEQYFQAPKEEFSIRDLPFSEFKAYYRGKRHNNSEPLDISQITSIGLQMYGGVYQPIKQKGPATLEIDWIRAV